MSKSELLRILKYIGILLTIASPFIYFAYFDSWYDNTGWGSLLAFAYLVLVWIPSLVASIIALSVGFAARKRNDQHTIDKTNMILFVSPVAAILIVIFMTSPLGQWLLSVQNTLYEGVFGGDDG